MIERVTYGDVDLSYGYQVVNVRRPIPQVRPETEDVPGMDGQRFVGATLAPLELSFDVIASDLDQIGMRRAVRDLAGVLVSKEPKPLQFSSDMDLYYMAVPKGNLDMDEFVRSGRLKVTMLVPEGVMRGPVVTAPLKLGENRIRVGGTYRTPLSVSGEASGASGYVTVVLGGTQTIRFTVGSSKVPVLADSAERYCRVNGAVTLPTINSDWLLAEPGPATIDLTAGSGSELSVSWQEMWI